LISLDICQNSPQPFTICLYLIRLSEESCCFPLFSNDKNSSFPFGFEFIALLPAQTKYTADVRPMFANGKKVAGKRPLTLITDGGHHFIEPFKKEFYTQRKPFSQHIRDIRLDGTVHNNKMERMNGEVRDREKVIRGIKRADTPILKGYQLFHNYIRPHESLQGDTPAERAGVKVEGENKWLTIIQNASPCPDL